MEQKEGNLYKKTEKCASCKKERYPHEIVIIKRMHRRMRRCVYCIDEYNDKKKVHEQN